MTQKKKKMLNKLYKKLSVKDKKELSPEYEIIDKGDNNNL